MALFKRKPDPEPEKQPSVSPPKPKRESKPRNDTQVVKRGRKWVDQDKMVGLTAIALCSGNCSRARELLLETQDLDIPRRTLYSWMNEHMVTEYARVRQEVQERLGAELADKQQDLANGYSEVARIAQTKLKSRVEGHMEDRDLINASKTAVLNAAVAIDKSQLLNDRPTSIVKQDAASVLRKLKSRGVIDVEVVEEEEVRA